MRKEAHTGSTFRANTVEDRKNKEKIVILQRLLWWSISYKYRVPCPRLSEVLAMIKWSTTAFLIWTYRLGALTHHFRPSNLSLSRGSTALSSSAEIRAFPRSQWFPDISGFLAGYQRPGYQSILYNITNSTGSFRSWLWWSFQVLTEWSLLVNKSFYNTCALFTDPQHTDSDSSSHTFIKCRKIILPI
jgi:hypothetical protein